ncbi:hypothetical protein ACF3MZ_00595 [Paenibacillaceae bacterium WGS1546]|uniref:hypothetical protein n=1 Tax=Cohnella sp. WGS1546 TaxID=3366810 RepID=UPI00372CF726
MKKINKTTMTLSAALLALALIGTACSSNNNNANQSPTSSPSAPASPSASQPPESESPDPSETPQLVSGTGLYVGLQDSHSIEITTDEGPTGFQIGPDIYEKVESWEKDTPVKFEYTVETMEADGGQVEQKTIVSIEQE